MHGEGTIRKAYEIYYAYHSRYNHSVTLHALSGLFPVVPAKILLGILPEMNVFKQKQRFKLLGEYLSKRPA